MVGQIVGYELRANRGESMVKGRVEFRQVERSDHKEVGVSADTDNGPGGGFGGESRFVERDIGLYARRAGRCCC